MTSTTPNLGLKKPDYGEVADISVLNENYDKIDTASVGGGGGLEPGMTGELFPDGEGVYPREMIVQAFMPTVGRMYLSYWTPQYDYPVIANMEMHTFNTAASDNTLIRMGLYEIDGAGGGTLIASTPNDLTLFQAGSTIWQRAFSAPVDLVAGQRYAMAFVIVGGNMPNIRGRNLLTTMDTTVLLREPRRFSIMFSQTDLPMSFVEGDLFLTDNQNVLRWFYGRVST